MTKLMLSSSSAAGAGHLSSSLLLLLSFFLMMTSSGEVTLVVRAESSSSLRGETTSTQQKNGDKIKLTTFPLIPGDSAEGRRRRQKQRKRRQLASTSSSSADDEEQQEESTPLELQRDQLYEGYGVHYVDLWIGCPAPQRVTVIVDTGSSVTGFPCEGCHHCGGSTSNDDSDNNSHQYHTDTVFHQNKSTCFQKITTPNECLVGTFDDHQGICAASKHYSEGSSWEAFEAKDVVYTGGDHSAGDTLRQEKQSFSLHFGCQDKVTGLFETQLADGIMGLYNSPSSFWYQAYASHAIEKQMFSLCFSEPGHVERTGTPAGAMVLGGSDTRLHQTSMVYANQISKNGKYKLHLEKVYLLSEQDNDQHKNNNNKAEDCFHKVQIFEENLNNGNPGVILDSGTTATYLTKQLARHFVQVFNSLVSEDIMVLGSQKVYRLTRRQLEQLPTIVFQLQAAVATDKEPGKEDAATTTTHFLPGVVGKDLDPRHAGKSILVGMPPSRYFIRVEDKDDEIENDPKVLDEVGHYKLNIFFSKSKNRGGVLGANFMRGHDVLFDMENSRVGFALSKCEYSVVADDEEAG